jgi:succinate-semialdehyde dehydrogenase/glutarate-semialdehyde dehydrogenase
VSTGSTEVGRVLLEERPTTSSTPRGSSAATAPFLVFADADLDAALEGQ